MGGGSSRPCTAQELSPGTQAPASPLSSQQSDCIKAANLIIRAMAQDPSQGACVPGAVLSITLSPAHGRDLIPEPELRPSFDKANSFIIQSCFCSWKLHRWLNGLEMPGPRQPAPGRRAVEYAVFNRAYFCWGIEPMPRGLK